MRPPKRQGRPLLLVGSQRVTASLSPDGPTAVAFFEASKRVTEASGYLPSPGMFQGLAEATAALREQLSIPTGTAIDIAVMRPLVSVRTTVLPPAAPHRLIRLLQANARRFFPWKDETIASVLSAAPRGRRQSSERLLIAGVRLADAESISRGVADGGLSVGRMAAAPLMLIAAMAGSRGPSKMAGRASAEPVLLLTPLGSALEGTVVQQGQLLTTVAWPLGAGDGDTAPDEVARCAVELLRLISSTDLKISRVLLPDAALAAALVSVDSDASIACWESALGDSSRPGDPVLRLLHAGRGAIANPTAEFLTPDATATLRSHNRRLTGLLAVAATVMLLGMPAVHLWGLKRELTYVQDARGAVAESAAAAFEAEASIRRVAVITDRLASIERVGIPWTGLLTSLALELPKDAYLLGVDGGPKAFRLSGVTGDSTRTREALARGLPSVVSWRAVYDEALGTLQFEVAGALDGRENESASSVERPPVISRADPDGTPNRDE